MLVLFLMAACLMQAQVLNIGFTGDVNVAYLSMGKHRFFNEYGRKWKYYPGSQAGIALQALPVAGNISPLIEIKAQYTTRKFGAEFYGCKYNNAPSQNLWVKAVKTSHDVDIALNAGIMYKGIYFKAGVTLERFISGKAGSSGRIGTDPEIMEKYDVGKAAYDFLKTRWYASFELGYQFIIKRKLVLAPYVAYLNNIAAINRVDVPAFGSFEGRLNSLSIGLGIFYSQQFKKKQKS